MESNTKPSLPAGSSCTTEEWNQLRETVTAFFSKWLATCVTCATTTKMRSTQHYSSIKWYDNTQPTTPETLPIFAIVFVSRSYGEESPSASQPSSAIVVSSCLEPQREEELDWLCQLITELTGIDCDHY